MTAMDRKDRNDLHFTHLENGKINESYVHPPKNIGMHGSTPLHWIFRCVIVSVSPIEPFQGRKGRPFEIATQPRR